MSTLLVSHHAPAQPAASSCVEKCVPSVLNEPLCVCSRSPPPPVDRGGCVLFDTGTYPIYMIYIYACKYLPQRSYCKAKNPDECVYSLRKEQSPRVSRVRLGPVEPPPSQHSPPPPQSSSSVAGGGGGGPGQAPTATSLAKREEPEPPSEQTSSTVVTTAKPREPPTPLKR